MPKIDPVTGCLVQTEAEFWQDQANEEGQGRSGGDLRADFYDDMERDRKEAEDRYREPKEALDALQRAVKRFNEGLDEDQSKLPIPVEVLEVLEVRLGQGMRESSLFLRARATYLDGQIDIIEHESWSDSGTRMDPPDHDENVFWEGLDDEGYKIEWEHMYTIALPDAPRTMETCARQNKVEWLHNAIRKGGCRARVHEGRLEYDRAKRAEVYAAIAKHVINYPPTHNLFNGATL